MCTHTHTGGIAMASFDNCACSMMSRGKADARPVKGHAGVAGLLLDLLQEGAVHDHARLAGAQLAPLLLLRVELKASALDN